MFKDVLGEAFPIIEKVAPTIAGVLGSPLIGVGTSVILSSIAHIFNLDPPHINDLGKAILTDPESNDKLAELENVWKDTIIGNKIKFPSDIEVNVKAHWDNQ